MKAVFLTDLPESCKECRFADFVGSKEDSGCFLGQFSFTRLVGEDVVYISDEELEEGRLDDCPLKPLPDKWLPQLNGLSADQQVWNMNFAGGWNACLKKITGETE